MFAALGALQILKEKNIKVPEEIALVGFGNEPFTSMLSPSITSVNQHSSEIGKQAALTFLERVKHPEIKQTLKKYILNAELIVRDSSNIKKTDKRKALKMLSRLSTFLFRVF
ncbi:substrate-binding domain-containing protein [Gaetbulibacter saemankumensis]|uniref:substrate-binding domain-containing protein n=1 Tax=Gaetbulibacter saemankumensis TaxID=311208 RepID=UPI00293431C4|nr:substrate-binding domain-containing protein [Gaetbulibacter saemankumensis]